MENKLIDKLVSWATTEPEGQTAIFNLPFLCGKIGELLAEQTTTMKSKPFLRKGDKIILTKPFIDFLNRVLEKYE